ncbi:hypothetical protein EON62_00210 [archaeon]|nr:MAG: hypothetical protein EON62_00210 [archaeon]
MRSVALRTQLVRTPSATLPANAEALEMGSHVHSNDAADLLLACGAAAAVDTDGGTRPLHPAAPLACPRLSSLAVSHALAGLHEFTTSPAFRELGHRAPALLDHLYECASRAEAARRAQLQAKAAEHAKVAATHAEAGELGTSDGPRQGSVPSNETSLLARAWQVVPTWWWLAALLALVLALFATVQEYNVVLTPFLPLFNVATLAAAAMFTVWRRPRSEVSKPGAAAAAVQRSRNAARPRNSEAR